MKFNDPRKYYRPFWGSLVYTKDGDLDLSWCFVLLMGLCGVVGFLWVLIIHPASIPVQIAAWTFLGGAFVSVLIAAIPIAKAKILADSRVQVELAQSIASAGMSPNVTASTDVYEVSQSNAHEIG